MSDFDELRFSFRDASAEQRLAILRSETFRRLPIILGFAELLRRAFEQPVSDQKHEEMKEWISKVIFSTQSLRDLIDVLTSMQDEVERGRPELQSYESLIDAIRDTAQKLALPLAEAVDDPEKILIHSQYPLVLLDEPKYHREISFTLLGLGYAVDLLSFVENRMFRVEHQIVLSTLDEVSTVINQWLVEQRTLDEMQMLYPLPKNGG
jgi:hypothetical protein